jgi:hypothetical protein
MTCSLVGLDDLTPVDHEGKQALAGSLVSSLHRLKDTNNQDGGFFVFGDVSCRTTGTHRLHFSLFDLHKESREVKFLGSITSKPFLVVQQKDFRGLEESTYLSRAFSDQGVRLRLRKEPRTYGAQKRGYNGYTRTSPPQNDNSQTHHADGGAYGHEHHQQHRQDDDQYEYAHHEEESPRDMKRMKLSGDYEPSHYDQKPQLETPYSVAGPSSASLAVRPPSIGSSYQHQHQPHDLYRNGYGQTNSMPYPSMTSAADPHYRDAYVHPIDPSAYHQPHGLDVYHMTHSGATMASASEASAYGYGPTLGGGQDIMPARPMGRYHESVDNEVMALKPSLHVKTSIEDALPQSNNYFESAEAQQAVEAFVEH